MFWAPPVSTHCKTPPQKPLHRGGLRATTVTQNALLSSCSWVETSNVLLEVIQGAEGKMGGVERGWVGWFKKKEKEEDNRTWVLKMFVQSLLNVTLRVVLLVVFEGFSKQLLETPKKT